MTRAAFLTRLAGFSIVIVTMLLVTAGYWSVRRDIQDMREAGRENILWTATQLQVELMRFQRALADFGFQGGSSPARINERYDILWSRVGVFQQGSAGARLRAYDDRQVIRRLFDTIQGVEPLVVGLEPGDRITANRIKQQFDPFLPELAALSREVLHGEEAKRAALREELARSSALLTLLTVAAVVVSLIMLLYLAREVRVFRELAQANRRLLEESDRLSRAKSQFLAMMSHELRTPMNGIMGLLALVRRRGLPGDQRRLVDQAERIGRRMITLLRDILDYLAAQEGALELRRKPFDPARLAEQIAAEFRSSAIGAGGVADAGIVSGAEAGEGGGFAAGAQVASAGASGKARAGGGGLRVTVAPGCPACLRGDAVRLRQILTHLVGYVAETAGTRDLRLELGCVPLDDRVAAGAGAGAGGASESGPSPGGLMLEAVLSFSYDCAAGSWTPSLIMGEPEGENGFASEALGPAVARGLVAGMGGSLGLEQRPDGRIAVRVRVPVSLPRPGPPVMMLVTQSASTRALFLAAVGLRDIEVVGPDSAREPTLIVIETGGAELAQQAAELAEAWPDALLIALGRPHAPEAFDAVIDMPLDVAALREMDFMRLATAGTGLAGSAVKAYDDVVKQPQVS